MTHRSRVVEDRMDQTFTPQGNSLRDLTDRAHNGWRRYLQQIRDIEGDGGEEGAKGLTREEVTTSEIPVISNLESTLYSTWVGLLRYNMVRLQMAWAPISRSDQLCQSVPRMPCRG